MWDLFAVAVVVGALFLYVPGCLIARALAVPRVAALAAAPLVSVALYCVLAVVYPSLGIFCTWATLGLPVLALAVAAFAVSRLLVHPCQLSFGIESSRERTLSTPFFSSIRFNPVCAALYVAAGVVVMGVVMLGNLQDASSFAQEFDNVHHLGVTRSFLDSGNWSSFASNLYATPADVAIMPLTDTSFYPSAWNCVSALIVSLTGISIELAGNAVNFLFAAVVYPLSMFLFMRTVFRDRLGVVAIGSICALAFTSFPGRLLIFGPLYPNAMALALVPAAAALFVALLSPEKGISRHARGVAAALFAVGIVSFAFMQPNAVFTVAVLLAPYVVYRATFLVDLTRAHGACRGALRVLFGALALAAVAAVWVLCTKLPFLQGVIQHLWPAYEPFLESFIGALSLAFQYGVPQWLAAALVVVGGVATLVRREYLWIAMAYAFSCAQFMVSASHDGPIKHLLTGFWYTDTTRIAAYAVVFAVPLVSLGLWAIVQGVVRLFGSLSRSPRAQRGLAGAVACAVALVFAMLNYFPGYESSEYRENGSALGETPFGALEHNFRDTYTLDVNQVYAWEERDFVQRVKEAVPEDALIVNVPDDGSAFAYGTDDLRVYYRYLRTYGEDTETPDSVLIRNRLDSVSTDERVQQAVRDVGAAYVLKLDCYDWQVNNRFLFTYGDGSLWSGIRFIGDDTPGFETVLADGDMRLYRITAVE